MIEQKNWIKQKICIHNTFLFSFFLFKRNCSSCCLIYVLKFRRKTYERRIITISRIITASGEFIVSLANEGGSREFLESEGHTRIIGTLLRAKIEINSSATRRTRRFTARDASRRLIKTESALGPTEKTPCLEHGPAIFSTKREEPPLLCTYAFRVRETGLRRIIIPFQVNGLYLTMWVNAYPIRARWCILLCTTIVCIPDAIATFDREVIFFSCNHLYLN